jgi:hypothetical protein
LVVSSLRTTFTDGTAPEMSTRPSSASAGGAHHTEACHLVVVVDLLHPRVETKLRDGGRGDVVKGLAASAAGTENLNRHGVGTLSLVTRSGSTTVRSRFIE